MIPHTIHIKEPAIDYRYRPEQCHCVTGTSIEGRGLIFPTRPAERHSGFFARVDVYRSTGFFLAKKTGIQILCAAVKRRKGKG